MNGLRFLPASLLGMVAGADLATTLVGLGRGLHESAPLAALALSRGGVIGLVVLTMAALALELAVLGWMPRFRRAGWLVSIGLGLVPVVSNLVALR